MSELITYEREQKMEDGVLVGISKKKKKKEKRKKGQMYQFLSLGAGKKTQGM